MVECATCCYSDGGGVYLLERKGDHDTSRAVRAEYPESLSLSPSISPSSPVKPASLMWPRQQAFSIGPLPGQHRGRVGQREEERKRKVQETREGRADRRQRERGEGRR